MNGDDEHWLAGSIKNATSRSKIEQTQAKATMFHKGSIGFGRNQSANCDCKPLITIDLENA